MYKKINLVFESFLKYFVRLIFSFGIKQNILKSLKYLPKYYKGKKAWLKQGGRIDKEFLILNDFNAQAGNGKGQYFHQDLLVAGMIYKNNPERHIDIGSRIDGFVAHVASFREIEVIDIRSLSIKNQKNIKFMQLDVMTEKNLPNTDSLSCLHAIEHFGLGRYGDIIDKDGHIKGLINIIKMLKKGGILYISFPIGLKNEVHFNNQRVFNPNYILNLKVVIKNLDLLRFDYIDKYGELKCDMKVDYFMQNEEIGCGIFTFKKLQNY